MQGAVGMGSSGCLCIPISASVSLELYGLGMELCRVEKHCLDTIYFSRSLSLPVIHFYLPFTVFLLLHKSIQPLTPVIQISVVILIVKL